MQCRMRAARTSDTGTKPPAYAREALRACHLKPPVGMKFRVASMGAVSLYLLLSSQQLARGVFIPSASSPSLPLPLEQLGSSHHLETKSSGWPFPIPQCVQNGRLFQCSVKKKKRRDEDGMLQAPALSCW